MAPLIRLIVRAQNGLVHAAPDGSKSRTRIQVSLCSLHEGHRWIQASHSPARLDMDTRNASERERVVIGEAIVDALLIAMAELPSLAPQRIQRRRGGRCGLS
jgi:hypothetical protein